MKFIYLGQKILILCSELDVDVTLTDTEMESI